MAIFIALLFVVAGSVYYFSENSVSETATSQGPHVDSLSADNRPSFTANDTVPTPVGENLAPGTALIRVTVLDVKNNESDGGDLLVQVDEVMGYGSSTPPIPTGTEFMFDVSRYLQQNPKFKDQIKVDNELNMFVSHQESIQLNQSDQDKKQSWRFIQFQEE